MACSAAASRLVPKYFDPSAVAVVEGAVPETTALLGEEWDLIFFTGSPAVGKIVHRAAAQHLTPCVLELGGKNPTIVHASADLRSAARRIAYGRYLNSGHICTAPDHVLVWPEVKDEFVRHLAATIREFYGDDPQKSPDYGRVINQRNLDRLVGLLGSGKVAVGGQTDPAERYIAPTVLVDVSPDSPIMQDEVFGPILPVLEIDSVEAVIVWVNSRPRPLGLYMFAEDLDVAERILDATESGDAAINDCTIHPLVPELPFGGVGNSGMGKYHGRWGFEAFTNARGVLYHGARMLALMETDVKSTGLDLAQGIVCPTAFYWDRTDETRKWSRRFHDSIGRMPTMFQAGAYSHALHYLKAVNAAGTKDADKVIAKMREMPVKDFFAENGVVRPDGRMVHDMYLAQVKTPAESKGPWDLFKILGTVPGDKAFRPMSEGGCPLVK